MFARYRWALVVVMAIVLPAALAFGRGGPGGSGGGGGGGGRGGGGGGFSGGGRSAGGSGGGSSNAFSGGGGSRSFSGGGGTGRSFSGGGGSFSGSPSLRSGVGGSSLRSGGGSSPSLRSGGSPSIRSGVGGSSIRSGGSGLSGNVGSAFSGTPAVRSGSGTTSGLNLPGGVRGPSISGNRGPSTFGNLGGSSVQRGLRGGDFSNRSSFMSNNFKSDSFKSSNLGTRQGNLARTTTGRYQANRLNTAGIDKGKSFIHNQNINSNRLEHWTHNGGKLNPWNQGFGKDWNQGDWAGKGNWNKGNWNPAHWNNGNWNHNHWNNWNHNHWNHNHWNNWGWNSWWGFGGWGLWWPYYAFGGGWGVPYCNYGYYYPANYSTTYVVAAADETVAAAPDANAVAALEPDADSAAQFAEQGEANFRAGKYREALRDWKHALVDDPRNGGVMLLLAQTLFALGQYDEAAGATQAAMQMLPEDKWGVVATNYSQLYGNTADYTTQLRALEKARTDEPDNPALRFLLGFHYGFLNYPKNAVKELDKALTLVPKDLGSFKLRQMFAAKWPEAPPPPAAAVEAAKEAEQQGPAGEGAPPAPAPAPAPTPA